MLFTEWNQEKALKVRYEEGIEKGCEEFLALLKSGKTPEEIIKLYDKNEYKTENTVK
ncbi:hypothetical protein FACS1894164_18440 [Spirochaetia bacterium]|nr:hypothetical protein FACS1894164_18440 [Spirochaetia bacterium]